MDVWRLIAERKIRVTNQLNPYVVSDRTNPITSDFAGSVLHMWQGGLLPPS